MYKLIDYIRLRRAGFSKSLSWKAARDFTILDKLIMILWCLHLLYAVFVFVLAINIALIHKSEFVLIKTRLSYHDLKINNSKLEKSVVALLNGQPIKVDDNYYVFNKKIDNSIN